MAGIRLGVGGLPVRWAPSPFAGRLEWLCSSSSPCPPHPKRGVRLRSAEPGVSADCRQTKAQAAASDPTPAPATRRSPKLGRGSDRTSLEKGRKRPFSGRGAGGGQAFRRARRRRHAYRGHSLSLSPLQASQPLSEAEELGTGGVRSAEMERRCSWRGLSTPAFPPRGTRGTPGMRGLGCADPDARTRMRGPGCADADARTRMRGLGSDPSEPLPVEI